MSEHEPTFCFETPNFRGEMMRVEIQARSEAVARYRARRAFLAQHGIRVRPNMLDPVRQEASQ